MSEAASPANAAQKGGVMMFSDKKILRSFIKEFAKNLMPNNKDTLMEALLDAKMLEEDFDFAKSYESDPNVRNVCFWLSLRLTPLSPTVAEKILPFVSVDRAMRALYAVNDENDRKQILDTVNKLVALLKNENTIPNAFALATLAFPHRSYFSNPKDNEHKIFALIQLFVSKYIASCYPDDVRTIHRLLSMETNTNDHYYTKHDIWFDYSTVLYTLNKVFILIKRLIDQLLANNYYIVLGIQFFISKKANEFLDNYPDSLHDWLGRVIPGNNYVTFQLLGEYAGLREVDRDYVFDDKERPHKSYANYSAIDFLFDCDGTDDVNEQVPLPYVVLVLLSARIPNSKSMKKLINKMHKALNVKLFPEDEAKEELMEEEEQETQSGEAARRENKSKAAKFKDWTAKVLSDTQQIITRTIQDSIQKLYDGIQVVRNLNEAVADLLRSSNKAQANFISFRTISPLVNTIVMSAEADTIIRILVSYELPRTRFFLAIGKQLRELMKTETMSYIPIDVAATLSRRFRFAVVKVKDPAFRKELEHDWKTLVARYVHFTESPADKFPPDFLATGEKNLAAQKLDLYGAYTFNHRFRHVVDKALLKERVEEKIDVFRQRRYSNLMDRAFHLSRKIVRSYRRLKFHSSCKKSLGTDARMMAGCKWKSMALKIIRTIARLVQEDKGYRKQRKENGASPPQPRLQPGYLMFDLSHRISAMDAARTTFAEIRCALYLLTLFVRLDDRIHSPLFVPKWYLHSNALLYEFLERPRLPPNTSLEDLRDANEQVSDDDAVSGTVTTFEFPAAGNDNDAERKWTIERSGPLNRNAVDVSMFSMHNELAAVDGEDERRIFLVVGPAGPGKGVFLNLLSGSTQATDRNPRDIEVYSGGLQGAAQTELKLYMIYTPLLVKHPNTVSDRVSYSVASLWSVLNDHGVQNVDGIFFVCDKHPDDMDEDDTRTLLDELQRKRQKNTNMNIPVSCVVMTTTTTTTTAEAGAGAGAGAAELLPAVRGMNIFRMPVKKSVNANVNPPSARIVFTDASIAARNRIIDSILIPSDPRVPFPGGRSHGDRFLAGGGRYGKEGRRAPMEK